MSFLKRIMKKFQQFTCSHSQVMMKPGAKHKVGWKQLHKVKCRLCEKEWKELGEDLYYKYEKEIECHCTFEKGHK